MAPASRLVPILLVAGLVIAPVTLAGPSAERVPGYTSAPWGAWYNETWYNGGTRASIAIDAQDRPHVFSMGPRTSYRYWDGGAWQEDVLGSWARSGQLVLDSQGTPHVAFWAADISTWAASGWSNQCVYGTKGQTGWSFESVDTTRECYEAAITLDSQDRPQVLMRSRDVTVFTTELRYAIKDSQGWHVEVVEPSIVGDLDIHIKPDGTIAASWWSTLIDGSQGSPRYAERDADGSWSLEWVATLGSWPTMALAPDGTPHVAYKDESGLLIHAEKTSTGWAKRFVGNLILDPIYKDIAVDKDGVPHIVYEDGNYQSHPALSNFWYASLGVEGLWHNEIVDMGRARGVELAVDSSNRPHIVYSDEIADFVSDPTPGGRTGYVTPLVAWASLAVGSVTHSLAQTQQVSRSAAT